MDSIQDQKNLTAPTCDSIYDPMLNFVALTNVGGRNKARTCEFVSPVPALDDMRSQSRKGLGHASVEQRHAVSQ